MSYNLIAILVFACGFILLKFFEFLQINRKIYWRDGWKIISRFDGGSIQSKGRVVDGVTEKHLFFENGNLYYKAFLVNVNVPWTGIDTRYSVVDDGLIQQIRGAERDLLSPIDGKKLYFEGVLDGKYVEYFESGILKSDYNFFAGKHDGEQLEYYENGNLREKGFFVNGKKHGKTYVLTEFGMVAKDLNYENGELVDEDDHITLLKLIINTKTKVKQDAEAIDEKNIDEILQWIDALIFTKYKQSPELNDDYKNEIEIIYQEFIEEFKNFNNEDVDVDYYHKIVLARVWNNIVDLDFDPDKYEWQEYHHMRYQSDFNDLNDDGKLEYIEATKKAIIGFGFVYDTLRKRLIKIEKLNSKFGFEQNTEFKKVDFILAQSHASVYANCVMVYSFEHLQSFSNSDKTVFENLFHGFKNSENYIMRNAIIKLSTDLASDLISESDDQDKIEKIKQGTLKLAQEIVNKKTGNYSQE
tara:strand:+ start:70 stop:1479 length:1410 start_codon:yes stop_codon:yes gene_type:complete